MEPRILVVDNYDSFVYNIVQYLAQIGAEVDVWRNDDPRFATPGWLDGFDGVLLSPGPGTPEEAGVCVDLVGQVAGRVPLFGVCLGLQSIGVAYGTGDGPVVLLVTGILLFHLIWQVTLAGSFGLLDEDGRSLRETEVVVLDIAA